MTPSVLRRTGLALVSGALALTGTLAAAPAVSVGPADDGAGVLVGQQRDGFVCGAGSGVTVVVDRAGLGGGASSGCDAGGGGDGVLANFAATGVELRYASRDPGFVCRVNDLPSSDPCVDTSPGNAYWGLWWSDGRSGRWTYATSGVGGLTVPAGGSVAFRYSAGDQTPPSVAPPASPDSGGSGPGGSGAPPPTSAVPQEQDTLVLSGDPGDPSDPQASSAGPAESLPVWTAPAVIAGLVLVGAGVLGARRVRGASGRP